MIKIVSYLALPVSATIYSVFLLYLVIEFDVSLPLVVFLMVLYGVGLLAFSVLELRGIIERDAADRKIREQQIIESAFGNVN